MNEEIPSSKLARGLTMGKTAAKMSRKALNYFALKPFLAEAKKREAQKSFNRETASLLFEGLSMLRGTALKAAQLLSIGIGPFSTGNHERTSKVLSRSSSHQPGAGPKNHP